PAHGSRNLWSMAQDCCTAYLRKRWTWRTEEGSEDRCERSRDDPLGMPCARPDRVPPNRCTALRLHEEGPRQRLQVRIRIALPNCVSSAGSCFYDRKRRLLGAPRHSM